MGSAEVPVVIGRYALYDRIASGGMASVHLGRLLGPVGFARTVAIKRLHPQYAQDPDFVAMFLDEARLAARIRHPHVVPTIDVVATSGELFLVMEYVQGESLARLIRLTRAEGGHVAPGFVTTILSSVLHGLHAAHEARDEHGHPLGIVHRDVSPQNILVGTDGMARVLDFGIAKAAGRIATTREGQLKGKLGYMAPEQIGGTVLRTTDVYAAAVVLWEALTGRRLFAGENEATTMKLVLEGAVVPPSRYADGIPAALDAITLRGLDREPEKRFATAADMALALEECLPPVPASRIGQWVQTAARKTLNERSERVATIESSSSKEVAVPVAAVDLQGENAEIATQLSSGSFSARSELPKTGRATSSALRIALVGLGCLLAGGATAVGLMRMGTGQATGAPPVAPSGPSVDVQEGSAAPPEPQAPLAEGAAATPSASAAASAPHPPAKVPARPASSRVQPPARPAPSSCDPPYYFNAQGNRVFKKECL